MKYITAMKTIDFAKLSFQEISHWSLRKSPTRELMTKLRCQSWEESKVDFMLITFPLTKLVIISATDHETFPVAEMPPVSCVHKMADFKKTNTSFYFDHILQPACIEIPWHTGGTFRLWEEPHALLAQTFKDMNYRKEWHNGILVYEGNNYGDTSTFYIIGEIR